MYNSAYYTQAPLPSILAPPEPSESSYISSEEFTNVLQITFQIRASISTSSLLLLTRRRTTESINTISRCIDEHVAQTCCVKPASTKTWCAHRTHHTSRRTTNTTSRLDLQWSKERRVLHEIFMVRRCAEGREQVEELGLLSLADALEIHNLLEIGV